MRNKIRLITNVTVDTPNIYKMLYAVWRETFRLVLSTHTDFMPWNGGFTHRVFGVWLVAVVQEQLYNLGLLVFSRSV